MGTVSIARETARTLANLRLLGISDFERQLLPCILDIGDRMTPSRDQRKAILSMTLDTT